MRIVIDNKIPFIKGVLEPFAEVLYLKGSEIKAADLADTDALIIRTRTRVNSDLLADTPVRFVGTATIGTDHIDTVWCEQNGIHWCSAPGCNSGSVMQYLAASLSWLQDSYGLEPSQTTLGVIGVGNVGSKVASMAGILGYNVLLNDPPREALEGSKGFTRLDELIDRSDIITLHVPLTDSGHYPTVNLAGRGSISRMKTGSVIINTSRGGVLDESALKDAIHSGRLRTCILDVWENEPVIDRELLQMAGIGTPHIAGYSVDGKAKGAEMIVNKLAEFFDLPLKKWRPENLPKAEKDIIYTDLGHDNTETSTGHDNVNTDSEAALDRIRDIILDSYPIEDDSVLLKNSPERFEELRGNYRIRREFGAYKITGNNKQIINKLKELGFRETR